MVKEQMITRIKAFQYSKKHPSAKKGLIFPGNRDTLTAYVRRDGLPALEKIYGWQYVAASFSCARCAMIDSHVQSILSLSRDFGRLFDLFISVWH
jgi:hypothetical protein